MDAGEGVDPAVMNEVAKIVAQSCSTCSKAMRAEGVKVLHISLLVLLYGAMLLHLCQTTSASFDCGMTVLPCH